MIIHIPISKDILDNELWSSAFQIMRILFHMLKMRKNCF